MRKNDVKNDGGFNEKEIEHAMKSMNEELKAVIDYSKRLQDVTDPQLYAIFQEAIQDEREHYEHFKNVLDRLVAGRSVKMAFQQMKGLEGQTGDPSADDPRTGSDPTAARIGQSRKTGKPEQVLGLSSSDSDEDEGGETPEGMRPGDPMFIEDINDPKGKRF